MFIKEFFRVNRKNRGENSLWLKKFEVPMNFMVQNFFDYKTFKPLPT